MSTPASPVPLRDMPWPTRLNILLAYGAFVVVCGGLLVMFGVASFALHPLIGVAYTVAWAGVALLAETGRRRRRDRRLLFTAWAGAHGWAYEPHSSVLVGRWTVQPFRGASRTAIDVLRGVVGGVPVISFTHGGSFDPRVRLAGTSGLYVVMATLPAAFPALTVAPEDPVSRTAGALGVQDIAVESAEFNRRWRVTCTDTRFAHAVLHPRLIERLLAPDAVGMSLLLEDRDVVVHAPGPTVLDDVKPRAALLADVVRLIPAYVLRDHPAPQLLKRPRRKG